MERIAIYARKSVYVEGSLSIENQINFCMEYMRRKQPNAEFEIFEDEGFSGSNTNRPQFIRLMSYVQLGKIDSVVCYKIDRIARNIVDFVNIFNQFQNNNVQLISISEGFDPSTPIGKMIMMFLASFAEMERMNTVQRVRDNNLALAKRGKWSGGGAPIGYKQGIKTLNIENGDAIREIFEMKSSRKNLTEIMDYINIKYDNFISSKNVLMQLLRKTIYVKSSDLADNYLIKNGYKIIGEHDGIHGYLRYKDKETGVFYMCVASDVKGIIDTSTWLQVQKIADENNKKENSKFSENYWLTKTLRCPICGNTYMGQTKNWCKKYKLKDGTEKSYTNVYEYYMCRDMGKGKYKTCTNNKRIRKDVLETYVEDYIITLQNEKRFCNIYDSLGSKNYDSNIKTLKREITKLNNQIEQLTEKITFASIKVSKVLMAQQDKLLIKQEQLSQQKEELEYKNIEIKNTKTNRNIVYQSICSFNKELPNNIKRELVMNIFESIVYDPQIDDFASTFC